MCMNLRNEGLSSISHVGWQGVDHISARFIFFVRAYQQVGLGVCGGSNEESTESCADGCVVGEEAAP